MSVENKHILGEKFKSKLNSNEEYIITNVKKYEDETKQNDIYYPFGITNVYFRLSYSQSVCVATKEEFFNSFAFEN